MLKGKFYIKSDLSRVIPILSLFLLSIVGYWQISFHKHPLKWDSMEQSYPWKYFIGDCLQNGILPLWNPYTHCGYPIHADTQSSAWYPITWLFGYFFGYDIYIFTTDFIFHIFLAGLGMFILGRKMEFNKNIALAMGIAYMFCGFFIGNAQHFMWIIAGTWLPFIIYSYLELAKERKILNAIVFSLFMFLMLTGAYPAFTMILAYFLMILFLFFLYQVIKSESRKSILQFLKINMVAFLFTLLNGMVLLVSVYKALPYTIRTEGITLDVALYGPLSPRSLISFLLPFGTVHQDMSGFDTDLSMANAYFGLLLLVFFILAFVIKKPPIIKLFI
ncbi:MAG: YfhO family protein, partial [Bacteroidales bacterium]